MCAAYSLILDKYIPGGIGEAGPEVLGVVMTLTVIAPRIAKRIPRKLDADEGDTK